jgi:hypothetical protein
MLSLPDSVVFWEALWKISLVFIGLSKITLMMLIFGWLIKQFEPYYTGLKCPVLISPDYGYYLCVYLYQIGVWRKCGVGSTNYKNLRIFDIRRVFNELSQQHSMQYNGGINVKVTY